MKKRVKKTGTGLFFDSFKHFKNNLSNLITTELLKLTQSNDLKEYYSLKQVNYKSKLPDMKKIGLIYYKNLKDNCYGLTEEAEKIHKIFNKYKESFEYPEDFTKKLETQKPEDLLNLLTSKEKQILKRNLLKLILSYFDTADFIRPYLLLIKTIEKNGIKHLDDKTLCNILAQTKLNTLNNDIDVKAFDNLDKDIKIELKRPVTYIKNFLQTSMIIDEDMNIIYDINMVKDVVLDFNDIDISQFVESYETINNKKRSTMLQNDFRKNVLKNYNYKCAISGKPIIIERGYLDKLYVLEAAHIIPYSEGGSFAETNGIALTPELHKLFDLNLFCFKYLDDQTLEVVITKNKDVKDNYNGLLASLSNKKINLKHIKIKPDSIAIEYKSRKLL